MHHKITRDCGQKVKPPQESYSKVLCPAVNIFYSLGLVACASSFKLFVSVTLTVRLHRRVLEEACAMRTRTDEQHNRTPARPRPIAVLARLPGLVLSGTPSLFLHWQVPCPLFFPCFITSSLPLITRLATMGKGNAGHTVAQR